MPNDTGGDQVTFTDEQQEHINKIIGAARIKEREKFEAKSAADKAQAVTEAEQAKLVADENWKALDETRLARITELEAFETKSKAYDELVDGMLKDKLKALGDAAKKAVAGLPESLSNIDKLSWLNANEGLFTDSSGPVGSPKKKVKLGSAAGKSPADFGHRRLRM